MQRQPRGGTQAPPDAPAGPLTLTLPAPGGNGTVTGPLAPGQTVEDDVLTVRQGDAEHAEILYGGSTVRFHASPGERYSFVIGPPIAGPPRTPPAPQVPGGLIDMSPHAPAPELPQREVHISTPRGSLVDVDLDSKARVAPLAVFTRYQDVPDSADPSLPRTVGVDEQRSPGAAQIVLDDTFVRAEAKTDTYSTVLAGGEERPRFAYFVDPEWTGPGSLEKRVIIVASPGVVVTRGSPPYQPTIDYKRRLVPQVVRVPHPELVPPQGTRLTLEQFVGIDATGDEPRADTGTPDRDRHVTAATSLTGVVIDHEASGARVGIKPRDTGHGAAYAYQVVPPGPDGPGEIRVIVGQGVIVDVVEPLPRRFHQRGGGPVPNPKKSQVRTGEGLEETGFTLHLIEVENAARVPKQGTPINVNSFIGPGHRREPDHHGWIGTDDLPSALAVGAVKLAIGFIPIVGPLFMIGDAIASIATGSDLFGIEVDDAGKVVLGIGAVLSLIPLAGGIASIVRASESATANIAAAAGRLGLEAEQLETTMARVGLTIQGDDAAVVARIEKAILVGDDIAEADAAAIKGIVQKAGVTDIALADLAATQTGYQLGLTMARSEVQNQQVAHAFAKAMQAGDRDAMRALAQSFARQNGIKAAGEAEDALVQAVRDVAKAEGSVVDDAAIRASATEAAEGIKQEAAAVTAREQALTAKHPGLQGNDLAGLRELGVDLDLAERLLTRKLSPKRLIDLAMDAAPRPGRPPQTLAILDGLTSDRAVTMKVADDTLALIAEVDAKFPGRGTYDIVEDLVSGNLRNRASLKSALTQTLASKDGGGLSELRLAADRATAAIGGGDDAATQIGAMRGVGGDVVDFRTQEVFQTKRVATLDDELTTRNLHEASNQLAGKGKHGKLVPGSADSEMPPVRPDGTPFTRVAQIEIANPGNAMYAADREAVRVWVREALVGDRADSVDRVVFINGNAGSPFIIDKPF